jgi:glycosyltransferase involved in cell wall biosynthesis
MTTRPLRICYFGTYRSEYSRNQIMIAGLRQAGVEIIECHAQLWTSIEDRVRLTRGGWLAPHFWLRVLRAYGSLLRQHRAVGTYDVLMVGYPGHFDVYLARLLAWFRRRPLVWDVFMSIYLIAMERQLDHGNGLTVAALRSIEGIALRLPDLLIADTSEYVAWYRRTHGMRTNRFRLVPTGADDRRFLPQLPVDVGPPGPLRVVYFGTFIPNHGVAYIVEAARQLADEPGIVFELIGDGPDRPLAQELARQYGLKNLEFLPWMEPEALARRVGQAQVVLGAFGQTPQSLMTVQNKIYEGLALARAVATGDSPGVRTALIAGEEVWLVDRDDPHSLAGALRSLAADRSVCARMAAAGYRRFVADYNIAAIGRTTAAHLADLITERSGDRLPAIRTG